MTIEQIESQVRVLHDTIERLRYDLLQLKLETYQREQKAKALQKSMDEIIHWECD